jgi:hypothetical protein
VAVPPPDVEEAGSPSAALPSAAAAADCLNETRSAFRCLGTRTANGTLTGTDEGAKEDPLPTKAATRQQDNTLMIIEKMIGKKVVLSGAQGLSNVMC